MERLDVVARKANHGPPRQEPGQFGASAERRNLPRVREQGPYWSSRVRHGLVSSLNQVAKAWRCEPRRSVDHAMAVGAQQSQITKPAPTVTADV